MGKLNKFVSALTILQSSLSVLSTSIQTNKNLGTLHVAQSSLDDVISHARDLELIPENDHDTLKDLSGRAKGNIKRRFNGRIPSTKKVIGDVLEPDDTPSSVSRSPSKGAE